MKALKASICVAVTALVLSLPLGAPSYAGEDEATTLSHQMKELYQAGKYREALPLAQKSLALREKEFGPDDAKLAMPLNDLGTIHYNLGQYAVAEQLYKRSLAIREKTSGPDQAELATGLNNLGDLIDQGEDHRRYLLLRRDGEIKSYSSCPSWRLRCCAAWHRSSTTKALSRRDVRFGALGADVARQCDMQRSFAQGTSRRMAHFHGRKVSASL